MRLFNVICICLALNLSVLAVALRRNVRVIGGTNANIMEFPYQVSMRLLSTNKHYCSGSIITNKLILTAAHCLFGYEMYYENTRIYTGRTNIKGTDGPSYKIQHVFIHSNFTGELIASSMYQNDIAIVKIIGIITFNTLQKMAILPKENVRVGETAVVSGWSLTSPTSSTIFEILQKAPMRIISHSDCMKQNLISLHDGQLCLFAKVSVGVCTHDSGGPLTYHGVIIGIVSFGVPCAVGLSDVFTNIYYYLDFIRSIMNA